MFSKTLLLIHVQGSVGLLLLLFQVNEEWKETGLKLGITIRDSCGSETKALDESLQFVVNRLRVCKKDNDTVPMFGVVGASMSLLTGVVANLLRLFQIPLVSFRYILPLITEKNRFGNQ